MSKSVKKYFGLKIDHQVISWPIQISESHTHAVVVFSKTVSDFNKVEIESILSCESLFDAIFQTNKLLMEFWYEKKPFDLIMIFQLSKSEHADTMIHFFFPITSPKL